MKMGSLFWEGHTTNMIWVWENNFSGAGNAASKRWSKMQEMKHNQRGTALTCALLCGLHVCKQHMGKHGSYDPRFAAGLPEILEFQASCDWGKICPWNIPGISLNSPRRPPKRSRKVELRRAKSTPDSDTVEKYPDTPLISIPILVKSMPSSRQKVAFTQPTRITIWLPFVSQYFCRSIRVRGRWDTP